MGSILYIRKCPPRGGDTLFASMYAAYEALSDRMKRYLEGLTAVHDGEDAYRGTYANYGVADKASYPRAEHPVIRTHPVTGKRHCTSIVALPSASSVCRAMRATLSCTTFGISLRIRCSSAASVGGKTPSRSGTIVACSIARCGTTGQIRDLAIA